MQFDEYACLQYDPFGGDFGAPSDRRLSDKIVTARKGGQCHDCARDFVPGDRVRRLAAVFDGAMRSYAWCPLCCAAAAISWTDSGAALDARVALRRANV